jgi:hypothetical protein
MLTEPRQQPDHRHGGGASRRLSARQPIPARSISQPPAQPRCVRYRTRCPQGQRTPPTRSRPLAAGRPARSTDTRPP